MGKLITGGILFIVGVFLTVSVVGAIPGTIMIFAGGAMMFAGFASLSVSTVKSGIAAGKIIHEMNKEKRPEAPAALAATGSPSAADEIRKLGDLLAAGLLTQEEFEAKKARILAS